MAPFVEMGAGAGTSCGGWKRSAKHQVRARHAVPLLRQFERGLVGAEEPVIEHDAAGEPFGG